VRARTQLDVAVKKDDNWMLLVYLNDDKNNPISGEIIVGNHTVMARGGFARIELDELPEKLSVIFPGNEKYLPAYKTVEKDKFPYWIFAVIILAAFVAYRMRKQQFIVFEWGDLPPVWDVGEEVNITIKNLGKGILRAFLDDEGIGVGNNLKLKFVFDEAGEHIVRVERLINGKVKEISELKIKIMNYGDAVIETFGELVKVIEKREGELKHATAREVVKKINVQDANVLLNLFEIAKYGYAELTRNDFSRAYQAYLKIVRGFE
jgi:hypothetical protein